MTAKAETPFDRMYARFRLFAAQGEVWARDFIPMSAGVNWSRPSEAVVALLTHELVAGVTVRNYGNAGGAPAVTRALDIVERGLHCAPGLTTTLVHGTTEGAYLAMQHWANERAVPRNAAALAIGHTFPLYNRLADDFGLSFHEVLGAMSADSFMPSAATIAEALKLHHPRIVFLIVPNNPLGEFVSDEGLGEICRYVASSGARLLVDRVCQMPWDEPGEIPAMLGPLMESGLAVTVDSFSKSESLAGLRAGFVVSDAATKAGIVELIKSRYLNPVTFPTASLAALRLVQFDANVDARLAHVYENACDLIFSEYPRDEAFHDFLADVKAKLPALRAGMRDRRAVLQRNFALLESTLAADLVRPLHWAGGFNVAICSAGMDADREEDHARALAQDSGIGVLTTTCFCTANNASHYFVRVGLTLPHDDFAEGLGRLRDFFGARRSARAAGRIVANSPIGGRLS